MSPNPPPQMPGHLPAKKPEPHHELPHREKPRSFFDGHNRVSEGGHEGIKQTLERDHGAREEIRKILTTGKPFAPISDHDIDKKIEELAGLIDIDHNGVVTPAEVKLALKKLEQHETIEKKSIDPFSPEGHDKLEKMKEEEEFLKKKFVSE